MQGMNNTNLNSYRTGEIEVESVLSCEDSESDNVNYVDLSCKIKDDGLDISEDDSVSDMSIESVGSFSDGELCEIQLPNKSFTLPMVEVASIPGNDEVCSWESLDWTLLADNYRSNKKRIGRKERLRKHRKKANIKRPINKIFRIFRNVTSTIKIVVLIVIGVL